MKFLILVKKILKENEAYFSEENLKKLKSIILSNQKGIEGAWGNAIREIGDNLTLEDVKDIMSQIMDSYEDALGVFPEEIVDAVSNMTGGKTNKRNFEGNNIVLEKNNPDKSIETKAKASGISKSILKAVYRKGLAAWKGGHRPGVPQHQWAMARVNSFITGKGGARKADANLWKKHKKK